MKMTVLERMALNDLELVFSPSSTHSLQTFLACDITNTVENYRLIAACLFGVAERMDKRYTTERERFSLSFERKNNKYKVDDYMLVCEITKIDSQLFYLERLDLIVLNKMIAVGEYNK